MEDYFSQLFHGKAGGIPAKLSFPTTDSARIALHETMWPSRIDAEGTYAAMVSHERFECAELAFRDLDRDGVSFPDGGSKSLPLLVSADGVARAKNGLTLDEVRALMQAWKAHAPDSVVADIYWVRLLNAAAWHARGYGPASQVAAEQWTQFKLLNDAAKARIKDASQKAKAHRLWPYPVIRVMADTGVSQTDLEAYALESLKRFPDELEYLMGPANRLTPQWGGNPKQFERFSQKSLAQTKAIHGNKAYAKLYMALVPPALLSTNQHVQIEVLRSGLLEYTQLPFHAEAFNNLQTFACAVKDQLALQKASTLWATFSQEQRSVLSPMSASCRAWSMQGLNDKKS